MISASVDAMYDGSMKPPKGLPKELDTSTKAGPGEDAGGAGDSSREQVSNRPSPADLARPGVPVPTALAKPVVPKSPLSSGAAPTLTKAGSVSSGVGGPGVPMTLVLAEFLSCFPVCKEGNFG